MILGKVTVLVHGQEIELEERSCSCGCDLKFRVMSHSKIVYACSRNKDKTELDRDRVQWGRIGDHLLVRGYDSFDPKIEGLDLVCDNN